MLLICRTGINRVLHGQSLQTPVHYETLNSKLLPTHPHLTLVMLISLERHINKDYSRVVGPELNLL